MSFRRAPSIKEKIVHSMYTTPKQEIERDLGTFPCMNCDECPWIGEVRDFTLPNGERYRPRKYVNCQSVGVVYLMACKCGRFYVGKTKQAFRQRIYEHILSIRNGKIDSPIALHVGVSHYFDLTVVKFVALEHILAHSRGGDTDKKILRQECRWIYKLQATKPPSLNESTSYKPFL